MGGGAWPFLVGGDTRLADPTPEMQIDMERLLYHIGRHALTAYNCFEE